jgi:hypothetical protein
MVLEPDSKAEAARGSTSQTNLRDSNQTQTTPSMIRLIRPADFDTIHQPELVQKIKELLEINGLTASEEDIQWAFIKHAIYFGLFNFKLQPREVDLNFALTIGGYLFEVKPEPVEDEVRQITLNS